MDPVLIVGAGPVGLIQAHMLSQLDVPVIIIDRHRQHLSAPKSHVISSRSMEICRQFGIDPKRIRDFGTKRQDAKWVRFVTSLNGEQIGVLPFFRLEPEVLRYTSQILHNIPQPDFEKLIGELIEGNDKVNMRRGWTWVSSQQDDTGVTSIIKNTYTGMEETIRSYMVIACDGANSGIVKSLNVPLDVEEGEDSVMTIHFSANLRSVVKDKVGMLHWIMDPRVRGVVIAYDLDGNQVLLHNYNSSIEPIESFTPDKCRSLIRTAIGCDDVPFTFLSCLPWRIRRQVTHDYYVGRIVFAGDAAHAFPPTGGFGQNTGIADAHNLSYKIASIYYPRSHPQNETRIELSSVLEAYQNERQPIAKRNAWQSVVWGRKVFDLVKAFGLAQPDLEKAVEAMKSTLKDEGKMEVIRQTVLDQGDQFNSMNLDLGYVYEPGYHAEKIREYVPAFRKGARLVHAWINVLNPSAIPLNLDPCDFEYLEEDMPNKWKDEWSYSTLDLIPRGTYVLIHGPKENKKYQELCAELHQFISIKRIEYGTDFELLDVAGREDFINGYRLSNGGAVLIRPDQHIQEVLTAETDLNLSSLVNKITKV